MITIKRGKIKKTRNGIAFFTGVILYQDEKLDYMFDVSNKQLFVFKWQRIPKEINESIYRFICDNIQTGNSDMNLIMP